MKNYHTLKRITENIYICIFIYYILIYSNFLLRFLTNNILSAIYFIITYTIIPLSLFIHIIIKYKNYSLKSILNVFFVSCLIGIPVLHFFLIGFALTEGKNINNIIILNTFIVSSIFSVLVGFTGLVINAIYIICVNIFNKNKVNKA